MTFPQHPRSRFPVSRLLLAAVLAGGIASLGLAPAHARWARQVVLSEVYGGGGNQGAPYDRDFIELYNPTGDPVSLEGWSVQYAPASGAFDEKRVIPLRGTLPPFAYYLIAASPEAGAHGDPLPVPDVVSENPVALAAASGTVVLARGTAPVTGPGDPAVVDLVGYGKASTFAGDAPAPGGSNTRSLQRRGDGGGDPGSGSGSGWDTGQNGLDWVAAAPGPRTSLDPPEPPERPVAVITPVSQGSPGTPVELDGSGSWDPGGDPLSYRWTFAARPAGSTASLADPTAPRTTLVPDQVGTYRVELTVSDGLRESLPAAATLSVRPGAGPLLSHGPNPARDHVVFVYRGDEAGTLQVFDAAARLVHRTRLDPGPLEYRWDLIGDDGRPLAPGLYLYLVVTEGGDRSPIQRLVVSP